MRGLSHRDDYKSAEIISRASETVDGHSDRVPVYSKQRKRRHGQSHAARRLLRAYRNTPHGIGVAVFDEPRRQRQSVTPREARRDKPLAVG